MKLKEIQSIIKDFETSSLTILELETDTVKLKLSKNKDAVVSVADEKSSAIVPAKITQTQVEPSNSQALNLPTTPIKSPLVGTYYEAATPGAKPFISAGERVKKGQVVCIIEAMKIMNEITSPVEGVVEKVFFKNGEVVGFDDTLFTIDDGNATK